MARRRDADGLSRAVASRGAREENIGEEGQAGFVWESKLSVPAADPTPDGYDLHSSSSKYILQCSFSRRGSSWAST